MRKQPDTAPAPHTVGSETHLYSLVLPSRSGRLGKLTLEQSGSQPPPCPPPFTSVPTVPLPAWKALCLCRVGTYWVRSCPHSAHKPFMTTGWLHPSTRTRTALEMGGRSRNQEGRHWDSGSSLLSLSGRTSWLLHASRGLL